MRPVSNKARIAWAVLGALVVCGVAAARSGNVVLTKGELLWGQYRSHKGVIALPPSPRRLDAESRTGGSPQVSDYPIAGVSSVLLRCQRPGRPFFTPEGAVASEAALAALREEVDAVYRLDMLPIVVLFDPDPSCLLASVDAYERAAVALVDSLKEDYWFLVCIADRCDPDVWGTGTPGAGPVALVRAVAQRVADADKGQVIAAGGSDDETNGLLLQDESPVRVIMRRTDRLSPAADRDWAAYGVPIIDVVDAAAVDGQALEKGVRTVLEQPAYGFAIEYPQAPGNGGASPAALLDELHGFADACQKGLRRAAPPDRADTASLKPGEQEDGFVSLFNGKDLSGWVELSEPGNFVVKEGAITLTKYTGGWLRSWDAYGDFAFRGEYKIAEGGNSGFFLRAPLVGRQSRIGFEFQIRGQAPEAATSPDSTGSIYDVRPPDVNCMRPGEWNEVEITCVGTEVRIVWNGQLAHHFRYEEVEAMGNRATRGYIGLQDHHNPVQFRNLRIKRLD